MSSGAVVVIEALVVCALFPIWFPLALWRYLTKRKDKLNGL